MITYEDRRLRTLADQGRWTELLGRHRQARAAGRLREAGQLGHLIAFGAPPELAARLFDAEGGPGSTADAGDHDAGPLWEVLATRHSWRRLALLLGPTEVRRLVLHTRALLGEDLREGAEPDPEGVPLALEPWELAGWEERNRVREYLRTGGARRALFALPGSLEGLGPVDLPGRGETVPGLAATRLLSGYAPWLDAVCVRGTAPDAIAHLTTARRITGGYLPLGHAYPTLVLAASDTPAHGTAQGRLALWRVLTAMTGAAATTLPEIRGLAARLRCFTWSEPDDELRYLHLALEDPATGLTWALSGALPEPAYV
ncbi:hypothetical protein CFP65_6200 [Kitasatospora sp. MMS16-BH015]|uniref:hypothetical protein n=1 Tax=Kitasatospora sp. MMS16-BH015 TaxID=2018025 RepID=UPI000CA11240|nr:hypothetical protein [Kitasatospora sp. MMS16-BH015]AUG80865.1 hypothetical protein CFP65_6200 [Kitasatospora sp. MMS16-BH015]